MPRVGLNTARVVKAAEELIDELGLDNLTLAELAKRLNVKLPSLYKHIDSLRNLRELVTLEAQHESLAIMKESTIGKADADAVLALTSATRQWALAHPGRYAVTLAAPHRPNDTTDKEILEFILRILAGFNLQGNDAIDAARALRATLHGFVSLESKGGFGLPADVDRSFNKIIVGLTEQMAAWGRVKKEGE